MRIVQPRLAGLGGRLGHLGERPQLVRLTQDLGLLLRHLELLVDQGPVRPRRNLGRRRRLAASGPTVHGVQHGDQSVGAPVRYVSNQQFIAWGGGSANSEFLNGFFFNHGDGIIIHNHNIIKTNRSNNNSDNNKSKNNFKLPIGPRRRRCCLGIGV